MAGEAGPRPLQAICRKAMAEVRGDRYPDVPSLSSDVTRYLDGAAVSAYPESLVRRAMRVAKRHRTALGIVAAYLAVRALIFFFTGR
jgi:serine/threonine-protein kinase